MIDDQELLRQALDLEAVAQRELLEGDDAVAAEGFVAAADAYRQSWEAAGPAAFGRLVGMLKARVLAGAALEEAAAYARAEVPEPASPTAWYVRGICAAIEHEPPVMRAAAEGMQGDSEAFGRAADALAALADADGPRFEAAVRAIHDDFAGRDHHLTGVAIADTAIMFERLAARAA